MFQKRICSFPRRIIILKRSTRNELKKVNSAHKIFWSYDTNILFLKIIKTVIDLGFLEDSIASELVNRRLVGDDLHLASYIVLHAPVVIITMIPIVT